MNVLRRCRVLVVPLAVGVLVVGTAGVSAAKAASAVTPGITSALSSPSANSGSADTDTVTVHGTAKHGAPTGTVTFQMCGPTASAVRCTSPTFSPVTVGLTTGTKNRSTARATVVLTTAGWYCFLDEYNGDGHYRPVSDNNAKTECFDVTGSSGHQTTPGLSSSLSSSSITLGGTDQDTATVTGTSAGGPPTGSVTFSACGPTSGPTPCTAPDISPVAVELSAESGDRSEAGVTIDPGSTGWYCFLDQYSGDSTYTSASDNDTSTECLDVTGSSGTQVTPTISSALSSPGTTVGGSDKDTVTVTGTSGRGAPTGSVTFGVCGPTTGPAACTAPNVEPATAALSQVSNTTSQASATLYPGAPGWYCFLDQYSGDGNYNAVSDNNTSTECLDVTGSSSTRASGTTTLGALRTGASSHNASTDNHPGAQEVVRT